ncbi:P-loop containing nucleoside triphosphate hydrolase protein [Canariomyces notabilis]|uniref:ATP-dependent RNA helicase ROK1 n=1 Tax=Canariomyces notabilis TaxID=2074819 RepID=A0AAN6TMG7_9PEZI|nr:P-loop containing nucleoside triphosphate hydrolase protein [Canariomyces arenarius]
MDILKVLSRGIKPNIKNKTQAATATAQLPSAGAVPHPQLFHDVVRDGSPRGKKRKRRRDAPDHDDTTGRDEEDDVSDVDYFAPKKPSSEAAHQNAQTDDAAPSKKRKIKLLDEDGCRQILRSHRLKFTVLSGLQQNTNANETAHHGEAAEQDKKKRRKSAETEAEKQPKKDDQKKQIHPQPLTSFQDLRHVYDVAPQLAENISAQGFRVPTEVQMGSLPLLLRPDTALKNTGSTLTGGTGGGVDFLAVAPTGSGKTITFLIPAIDGVLKRRAEQGRESDEHVLEAVIVAPTRELASQIVNEGRKLAIGTGVRVVLMRGRLRLAAEDVKGSDDAEGGEEEENGGEESSDEEESSDGEEPDAEESSKPGGFKPPARVDILVTTPKILLNFLSGGKSGPRKVLPTVRSLVLDEADVLLDPIFRKQTMGIWRACTHPDVSLSCWSATMASNIEALVTQQLEKRSKRADSAPRRPLIRLVVGLKDTAVPNITHKLIYTATEPGKLLALRQLLHPVSSADSGPPLRPPFLVFTQTIERAQALHDELKYDIPLEAGGSARIAVLHSSLPDSARSRIMARFRAGEVWVLITTDVLARGVDFAGVNGVVNYDVPTSAAAYVHRAGRTGRAGREGGVAVTFYTKDDVPFVKSVANVIAASEKQAGKDQGDQSAAVQKWLLDALPKVAKEDKRKVKVRGIESRRSGGKATITTKSSWERRKEHNRQQAIEASKRRKRQQRQQERSGGKVTGGEAGEETEWGGLDD